jgi:hypothetical protein
MKRLIFAAMIVGLCVGHADADQIIRWPDGRRVYVVDAKNLGFGRIQKPKGIDVIVLRHKGKWGVVPPSVYESAPARPASPYRIGN